MLVNIFTVQKSLNCNFKRQRLDLVNPCCIFFAAGESVRGITLDKKMQGEGNFPRNSYFTIDNLHHILTNRTYIAERAIKTNSETKFVKCCWEPIIEKSIFEKVARIMKKNRYRFKSYSEKRHDYLLKGLAFCHQCGDRLVGKSANGVGGKFFYYEHGAQVKRQAFLNKKFFKCQPLRFKAEPIENQVWDEILKVLLEPKNAKQILEKAQLSFKYRAFCAIKLRLKFKV
jgi:recombinase-like zinc beta ribbon protein/recombinase